MIIRIYEDRNPKDSIPTNLSKMFKHVLNCIYQPKIYHNSWTKSVINHSNLIQDEVERCGYKKIYGICANCLVDSYKNGYKLFFTELKNGHLYKNNPYLEKEMKKLIPVNVSDIGKNTLYEKYKWTVDNILDEDFISKFVQDVINNSESVFDLYK